MPVECTLCEKSYPSQSKLNDHIKVIHEGKRWQCTACPKTYSSKFTLTRHEKKEHNSKEAKKTSKCEKPMQNHKATIHERKFKTYQCEHCKDIFTTLGKLQSHNVRNHPDLHYYIHNLCGHKFLKRKRNLQFRPMFQNL